MFAHVHRRRAANVVHSAANTLFRLARFAPRPTPPRTTQPHRPQTESAVPTSRSEFASAEARDRAVPTPSPVVSAVSPAPAPADPAPTSVALESNFGLAGGTPLNHDTPPTQPIALPRPATPSPRPSPAFSQSAPTAASLSQNSGAVPFHPAPASSTRPRPSASSPLSAALHIQKLAKAYVADPSDENTDALLDAVTSADTDKLPPSVARIVHDLRDKLLPSPQLLAAALDTS
ncbi:hypothetical protein PHYC_00275 [Phycisphaerales bacterium]|nr:hypothetical protein PHYC_00275 [Phycisphaerales bacterium]